MKRFEAGQLINEIEVCGESNATLSAVMRTEQLIGISHPTCVYALCVIIVIQTTRNTTSII